MKSFASSKVVFISQVLIACVFAGCAGRAAHPIMIHQYGDDAKSCKAIESELQFIQDEIGRLIPKTNKTGKNVALGVAGWFFIVPWFFMDLSQAEQEEINALRQRYNHLVILATDKGCSDKREPIPDFKDQKAFKVYQERELGKVEDTDKPAPVVEKELTLEEARAKVAELEAQKNVPQPKN